MAPYFSIVVPTYNRESTIGRTLESVTAQSFTDYEILVIDNCSVDRTIDIISELEERDPRIHLLQNSENRERAHSRNRGMENARGKYLTFLDSDDLMYANNLADAAAFVEANGETDLFHNLYEFVGTNGRRIRRQRVPRLRAQVRGIAEGNFLGCIGVFLHQTVYRRVRFDETPVLTGSEDWEFWLRVLADYPLKRIWRVNSAMVLHEGQTVAAPDLDKAEKRIDYILKKVETSERLRDIYRPHRRLMRSSRQVFLASTANSIRRGSRARYYLLAALRQYPLITNSWRFWRALQLSLRP